MVGTCRAGSVAAVPEYIVEGFWALLRFSAGHSSALRVCCTVHQVHLLSADAPGRSTTLQS